MTNKVLMVDLSRAYDSITKMMQYNFNYKNFTAISEWIKDMWVLIETKRDEWMKEKDLYSKFETEHNRIEKEVSEEMKDKTAPNYQEEYNKEVTKRMNTYMDPYMNDFIQQVQVDVEPLEYVFQADLPAYVNLYMKESLVVNFKAK